MEVIEDLHPRDDDDRARLLLEEARPRLPQAAFEVTLTDPELAAHLQVEDLWDTAAYGCEAWAG